MKKIVKKYLYDTHKATEMVRIREFVRGSYGNHYETDVLYKTPNGRFFLHTTIEAMMGRFEQWLCRKSGCPTVEEVLHPMSLEDAQKWALRNNVDFVSAGIEPPELA